MGEPIEKCRYLRHEKRDEETLDFFKVGSSCEQQGGNMSCLSRRIGGFASVLLLSLLAATAQETATRPVVLTSPRVSGAVQFDVSPALRDAATQGDAGVAFHGMPDQKIPHFESLRRAAQSDAAGTDSALQSSVTSPLGANIGLNLLGLGNGFTGYSATNASPHVNLAVGDSQVVQWANGSLVVFDKSTGAVLQGPIATNAFWANFGGACESSNSGDLSLRWDAFSHRWLAAQNVLSSPYLACLAVSSSADFGGAYYRYSFAQSGYPDDSKWGVASDAYYQAVNNFGPAGGSFQGAQVCAYDRGKMVAGDSGAAQVCFQIGTADSSLLPADYGVGRLVATSQPEVLLGSIDRGAVFEYLFHADFNNPSKSTFTGANASLRVAGVAPFTPACHGFEACIPQQGSSTQLAPVSDRLMHSLVYSNFGDHQSWLVSHAVAANGSIAERWYEFRAPLGSTALSVYQQGTYAPDNNDRWMGSIAMDRAQNIALAYSISGQNLFPSASFAGRAAGDALGTLRGESSIVAGSAPVGDRGANEYSGLVLDAADQCTFWYTTQYSTGSAWSTRLSSFSFSGCLSSTSNFAINAQPPGVTVGQGGQGSVNIVSSINVGFNEAVTLAVSGAPAGVSTGFSLNPIPAPGSGISRLTFTVASTVATGTYPVTVTGTATDGTQSSIVVSLTVAPNFSMTALPTSMTAIQGTPATTTISVVGGLGFNSSVSLSALGVPTGATAAFSPSTIAAPGTGSSVMTINVGSTTAPGTYTITVYGTGGGLQNSTTVTLTVLALDFTLSASPSSQTISRGQQANYNVSLGSLNGFAGTVTLGLAGCPSNATCSFSPALLVAPGSSTLTISTHPNTHTGTYTLTINGVSGTLQHSATVSLTVR
jgi:hypothetical protein